MFRRILTFVAASVAAMSLVACQDDSKPTIEFERILYTVYPLSLNRVQFHP